jgi:hypothetical protein
VYFSSPPLILWLASSMLSYKCKIVFSYQVGKWSRELICMTRFLGWAAEGSVSKSPANGSISTEADADLARNWPFQYIVPFINSVMRRKENI